MHFGENSVLLASGPAARERPHEGKRSESPVNAELRREALQLRQEIIDATASQFTIPAPLARRLAHAHRLLDVLVDGAGAGGAGREALAEAAAALAELSEIGWVRTSVSKAADADLPVAKRAVSDARPRARSRRKRR